MPDLSILAADGARTKIALEKPRLTIGRSRESDVCLPDQWLSRQHAEISRSATGFALRDLGSKNGTLLNGAPLREQHHLRHGDVITLGEHALTFLDADGEAGGEADEDDEPVGTRVFSAQELSEVVRQPAQDLESLQRQNRLLRVHSKAARALLEHRPLQAVFELILDLLFEHLPVERGAILLVEGDPPRPVIKASRSRRGQAIHKVSGSIARRVLQERALLLVPNVLEDAAFKSQDSILTSGIRSALCAPLWYRSVEASADSRSDVIGLVYLDTLQRAETFNEDDLQVLTLLAEVAAAKIETARMLEENLEKRQLDQDLKVAADIQTNLLPRQSPLVPGYSLLGSNRPCRTIGGDYFDYGERNGELLLALGDVSGKGTGAALLMTVLRAAVRAHWADDTPRLATARINRTVCENVPEGKYITFFVARLDPASGRVCYVNAGHNPPLLMRADGSSETLGEGGMVLGLLDDVEYAEGCVELAPGDALVIFSDGVSETWNARDEEFGEAGLHAVVQRERGRGAVEIQRAILAALEDFAGGLKATDDRTLIVLKRDGNA